MTDSYETNMAIGYAGELADLNPARTISRAAEGGAIGFGLVVSRGTNDDQAVLGGDPKVTPLGITIRSLDREGEYLTGAIEYKETETMGLLQNGTIYAAVEVGGNPGDALKYNVTTGAVGIGLPGEGEAELPGTLESTAADGEIAKIRVAL